jgi:cell division protein FtsN
MDKTSTFTETKIKTESPVEFTIQIGAFRYENNANRLRSGAQYKLNDVFIQTINGLYKVRTGKYNNRLDAMKVLDEIKAMGYSDSFIIQSNF